MNEKSIGVWFMKSVYRKIASWQVQESLSASVVLARAGEKL